MALLISSEGLTNTVVVVTRYFGGIKLGPGGLVRAYTSSARMALEAAGRMDVFESVEKRIRTDYVFLGKIQNAEKDQPFRIGNITYEDKVLLDISYAPEDEKTVLGTLMDICSGSLEIL